MSTLLVRTASSLLLMLALVLSGCGEKAPKVDVNAQLAGLSGDGDAKLAALAELAAAGPNAASAVPKIIPLLKDEDVVVRRTAAYTLGAIGPAAKAAVPQLKSMLQTDDREQMTAVANAIRAIDASAPAVKVENVTNPQ